MTTQPPLKALFGRGPVYQSIPTYGAGSDVIAYSRAIGADAAIVLLVDATPQRLRAALDAFPGRVWVWAGPHSWRPDTWRGTLATVRELMRRHPVVGYIADVEDAPRWAAASVGEREALVDELEADARAGRSVGLTTLPLLRGGHPIVAQLSRAPSIWMVPQLYHLSAQSIRALLDEWQSRFGYERVIPAVYMSGRDSTELRAYLNAFAQRARGALYWHAMPAPTLTSPVGRVLASWTVSR